MTKLAFKMKPYIQPFEKSLALEELAQLTGHEITLAATDKRALQSIYAVETDVPPSSLLQRLVYWESITADKRLFTEQVKREATMAIAQNGVDIAEFGAVLPITDSVSVPRRRCLRYGPHGLHEYRGKFFPQLVRALLNIAKLETGSTVVDPMCGSGTTLVETAVTGMHAVGVDMNPLSVFMTSTKTGVLSLKPDSLVAEFNLVQDKLRGKTWWSSKRLQSYLSQMQEGDREYLGRWFAPEVLLELLAIKWIVDAIQNKPVRELFLLSLSNIVRPLSWQKNDDLRVRKELWDTQAVDVRDRFIRETHRAIRLTTSFLHQVSNQKKGDIEIYHGDAANPPMEMNRHIGKVDAIITSPPYATALPYLDTDRLSLIILGLLSRQYHRAYDTRMIGNREITKAQKRAYWESYEKNKNSLPQSVSGLIDKIHRLNSDGSAGFRRKNLPSLLSKYFFDMKSVFHQVEMLLRPGARAFFVVGDNHTVAGGKKVKIATADLLVDLAETVGLVTEEKLQMEMLTSRDIFRENASSSETVIYLKKKNQ